MSDENRERVGKLFADSFDQEEEESGKAKTEDRLRFVVAYYSGWRDALRELYPDLDTDEG